MTTLQFWWDSDRTAAFNDPGRNPGQLKGSGLAKNEASKEETWGHIVGLKYMG